MTTLILLPGLIISSIVEIARGLGKQTIAEHVSDEAILEVVSGLGVDHAQGFHIGPPDDVQSLFDRLGGTTVVGEVAALG